MLFSNSPLYPLAESTSHETESAIFKYSQFSTTDIEFRAHDVSVEQRQCNDSDGASCRDQKWIADRPAEKNHDTQQRNIRRQPGANSFPA